ncbi:type VI secretion system ATPase TssH [Salmonella enterica subsp. enterica serovar Napoli]|uniref:Type VI secretion system ATPase TssH n=1 Tax=Salmonella enterica subsp. enterica serovar Napoli TaxID=1151001 RepID=A0A5J2KGH1_SALET|nr:type VI secretion system ATPase TssH [Salmonella enterica]EBN0192152.1 type VI secretion system ATPase TssH [Salmonella enterica subsp. enterica serovar Enteritidis]EDS6569411.1 type VI secretion system ATPase TssH [Salmonella enterica subsp. enterica]EAA7193222.1 type VI secretion system ATPase TssH [Salmonella enterica subsp. enterica serovar Napoli]EAW0368733.1 type VI secretion system ATPase TssH [Salmonella enterica]EAX5133144.1 type VI secretion system ATPase TssH [Salmonella enterica
METPVSRSALYGKLAGPLFRSLESATAFCKLRSNPWVELTHWLHQLTQLPDNDILHVLRHYQIPLSDVEKALLRQLDMLPAGASAISDFSHHIDLSVEKAWMLASVRYGDNKIRSGWLLLALLTTPELRRVLSSICAPLATLPVDELTEILPSLIETSPEAQERPYDGSGLASAIPGENSQAIPNGGQDGKSALAKYCQDMTAQARDGKIDPVTGREHEIRTMTDILLRRRQNNPLLTGEAGVGKTAVVEGFALAIAQGEVPPALREVRLLALDVGALLAGASMKGEFESRLKGLLEEAGRSPQPVILFVDEVHTLVGAGGASGTGDAANLLKPALARGTLRTIGATTWSEYKRHIEKDPALTRRFQVLQIAEPEEIPAMEMVRGLVDTLEKHHNVLVLDEEVRAAVQLSHRYIPARQLPDKAISLLDTAAARVALTLHTPPASVQFLRQQLKAAEMERSLLQKQEKMGIQSDERRDALTARIFSLNDELTASESRWQRELELVHTLQELRVAESDADDKTTLQQAETALREWQGDAPVVFPEVSAAVVAAIVADWTGIPAGRMVKDEASQVLELPARLAQRVTGQDGALAQIGERIQTARAGLGDPRKPVGVFMLAGPSGVGKTETALALTEAIYGGEQNLVTINMSEFQEAHTVSTLKGAPPGYVGYGEGGVLTEAVRRHPWSVVLLDEIEKAHHDVHELFYQVFDKGGMEDGEGTHVDFKNTTLLLTTNVGSDLISQMCEDPALMPDATGLKEALMPELRKHFPAAFLGRVTVIPYLPLDETSRGVIARLHLDRLVTRMGEQHGVTLTYSEELVAHIVACCPMHETGARLLIGYIEQHILPRLSRYWLQAMTEKAAIRQIDIGVNGDEQIVFETTSQEGICQKS